MTTSRCECEKPILRERSERKGASQTYCGRCKLPIGLRTAVFKAA